MLYFFLITLLSQYKSNILNSFLQYVNFTIIFMDNLTCKQTTHSKARNTQFQLNIPNEKQEQEEITAIKTRKTINSEESHHSTNVNGNSSETIPSSVESVQQGYYLREDSESKQENRSLIVRCGYVQMDSKSFFNKWKLVYCILTPNKLYCYENQLRINLIHSINLQLMECNVTTQNSIINIFVKQFQDTFCFKTHTQSEFKGWFNDLTCTILYYKEHQKIKFLQGKNSIYSLKDAITQEQFLELAEDGDLLLMVTNDTKCALQRFLTNSQYDHVSVVLRFAGKINIFESNPNQGVKIYDWDQFHSEFHDYEKISFRKLYFRERQNYKKQLSKFIKSSLGKKYDLNIFSLKKQSSTDNDGYFCSSLVAKVYKILGLLEEDRSVNSYWPMDFTQRGGLKLLNSASLGEQRLIILNKHLKFGC